MYGAIDSNEQYELKLIVGCVVFQSRYEKEYLPTVQLVCKITLEN